MGKEKTFAVLANDIKDINARAGNAAKGAVNQQVKRNAGRFPDDFMFQLTKDEVEVVKSQIVTSPNSIFYSGQGGGRRKPPYAFTEQGIYMLATVLKGEAAEQQSIFIMRAFREMRRFIANNALLFEKVMPNRSRRSILMGRSMMRGWNIRGIVKQ